MYVLGAEIPASGPSKSKDTTPVQETVALPSEESRQKTDPGKSSTARGKTEPKATKQEQASTPETTAGKPGVTMTPASQVDISESDDDGSDGNHRQRCCKAHAK